MSQNHTELTCGERAVRCLIGESIDHIPYGVGLGWYPWGETINRWKSESGDPDLNPTQLLAQLPQFGVG